MLIRHDGDVWAVAPHYAVRFVDRADMPPYPDSVIDSTPPGFDILLAQCPPSGRSVSVKETNITFIGGQRLFDIGGIHVQYDTLAAIESEYGPDLEWRTTTYIEPIYALQEGKVVGFMMGIRPLEVSVAWTGAS